MADRRLRWILTVAALALVACGDDDDATSSATSRSSSTTITVGSAAIDWNRPVATPLAEGWSVDDCEGDAPVVCVSRNGQAVGAIEILRFPLATLAEIRSALDEGESATEAIEANVEAFEQSTRADRKEGCGLDYQVEFAPSRAVRTANGDAVRYGFTGTLADGRPSEHVVQFAALRDDTYVLVSATAGDPGGCLPTEGPGFTTGSLREFEPVFDALVRASGMPGPAPAA